MTVALMPNLTREDAYETTQKICRQLRMLDISFCFFSDVSEVFSPWKVPSVTEETLGGSIDMIIAVGGDGTMIRAAKAALPHAIPVLGVNAGNLAYLMGLEADELPLLQKIPEQSYSIEERFVISIEVYDAQGKTLYSDFCINDAVFARGGIIKLASFDLFCDGRFINRYTADGLIVATPTGSTAYNLAAGGPIVDPRVDGLILSPICPHSLTERTVLFSSNSVIQIVNPGNHSQVLLSCDGRDSIPFSAGYSAQIKKAKEKAKFIRLKDDTFLDILHKKMKAK